MGVDYVLVIEPDDAKAFEENFSNGVVKDDKMFPGCTWLDIKQELFQSVGFFNGEYCHAVILARLKNGKFWVDLTVRYGTDRLDTMATFAYNLFSRYGKVYVHRDSDIYPDDVLDGYGIDEDKHFGKAIPSLRKAVYGET